MLHKEIEDISVIFFPVVFKNLHIHVHITPDGFKLNIYVMVLMHRKFKYTNTKIKFPGTYYISKSVCTPVYL